jgi:hypothetical protein
MSEINAQKSTRVFFLPESQAGLSPQGTNMGRFSIEPAGEICLYIAQASNSKHDRRWLACKAQNKHEVCSDEMYTEAFEGPTGSY